MLFTFFIIITIAFFLIRLLPREMPTDLRIAEAIKNRWEALGYNKPLIVQYFIYLQGIFTRFDFGTSWKISLMKSATEVMGERILPTVIVNFYSLIISIPIGIALGIYAAIKKNKWQDHAISTIVILFVSVPSYVYAFLVQYIFFYKLKWVNTNVMYSLADAGGSYFSLKMFESLILPVMALSFGEIAGLCRFTRAELTETLT